MIQRLAGEIFYQLAPFPRLWKFNAKLRAADRTAREQTWASLGRDKLLPLIDQEWERARALDDKLGKLTAVLSIAVTLTGAAARTVLDSFPAGTIRGLAAILVIYAIASLFAGALVGFSGLRPKPRFGYGPDFAVQVRHPTKASAGRAADALAQFECWNAIRANESLAAVLAIRNGVVAFSVLALASLLLPSKTAPWAEDKIDVQIASEVTLSLVPTSERASATTEAAEGPIESRSDPNPARRNLAPKAADAMSHAAEGGPSELRH